MLVYRLGARDLENIRFAVSPAAEAVTSLRALRDPARFPLNRSWVRAVTPAVRELDRDVLRWVVNATMGVPDFLTPQPDTALTRFDDEMTTAAQVDRPTYLGQMRAVHGGIPPGLDWPDGPARLVAAIREYWAVAMAPFWPQVQTVLAADISYRGQIMTTHGAAAMLDGLGPAISYRDGLLRVERVAAVDRDETADGRGLTLQPRLFGPDAVIPFDVGAPPQVGYPVRGHGLVWRTGRPAPDRARDDLGRLVGATKARLLEILDHGATTTQLARQLGVSASAVSQHLTVLHRTGLVERHRVGKEVVYHRSDRARALLGE